MGILDPVTAHTTKFHDQRVSDSLAHPLCNTSIEVDDHRVTPAVLKSLQQNNFLSDDAIRGYIDLCLKHRPAAKNVYVFQVVDWTKSKKEILETFKKRLTVKHRKDAMETKFKTILVPVNVRDLWYLCAWDGKRVVERNNIETSRLDNVPLRELAEWYQEEDVFACVCQCGDAGKWAKDDAVCCNFHRTCYECRVNSEASNKSNKAKRARHRLTNDGGARDAIFQPRCAVCNDPLPVLKKRRRNAPQPITTSPPPPRTSNAMLCRQQALLDLLATRRPLRPLSPFAKAYTNALRISGGDKMVVLHAMLVKVNASPVSRLGVFSKDTTLPQYARLSWQKVVAGEELSPYAMQIDDDTYDWNKDNVRLPAHYINELPEDFLFQTMRLAWQMRLFPERNEDKREDQRRTLMKNLNDHYDLVCALFTDAYVPLVTFGSYCGDIDVEDYDGKKHRVVSGYTAFAQPVLQNMHGEAFPSCAQEDAEGFPCSEVARMAGFITVVGTSTYVGASPYPSPKHFLDALFGVGLDDLKKKAAEQREAP